MGTGCALILAGLASLPTPLPIGFALIAVGLYFAARGSKTARRGIKLVRRRMPLVSRGLNGIKHRLPRPVGRFIESSDPGV